MLPVSDSRRSRGGNALRATNAIRTRREKPAILWWTTPRDVDDVARVPCWEKFGSAGGVGERDEVDGEAAEVLSAGTRPSPGENPEAESKNVVIFLVAMSSSFVVCERMCDAPSRPTATIERRPRSPPRAHSRSSVENTVDLGGNGELPPSWDMGALRRRSMPPFSSNRHLFAHRQREDVTRAIRLCTPRCTSSLRIEAGVVAEGGRRSE